MARIGPDAYENALSCKGCRPMDFTGRSMNGFVVIEQDGLVSEKDLASWLELTLEYYPSAKKTSKAKRVSSE
jgi:hypothetical protein